MSTIKLPQRCDRAAVQAILPDFVAAMSGGRIDIDASEVEQVGQAALQLLVSARRTAPGAVIKASPPVREAAQLCGLVDVLFDGEA